MRNPIKSLRSNLSLKLIALFIAGGVLLGSAIGALTEFGFERHFVNQIQPHLRHYINQLNDDIGSPPSIEKAQKLAESRPIVIRIFGDGLRWASDDRLIKPKRVRRHDRDDAGFDKGAKPEKKAGRRHGGRRVFFDEGRLFVLKRQPGYEVFFGFEMRVGRVAWFPIIACFLVGLGLVGFYFATRWLFAPVRKIQEGVKLIGEGQVGYQIDVTRTDELGQLAERVNKMSTDLAQMLKAKRDMLLALSHELKSPLARSRVTLALMDPSKLQEDLLRDQQSIERLIDEVLESERAHQDHALLHRSETNIPQLIDQILVEDLIDLQLIREIKSAARTVDVDANQIRRLLRNLLENAQRYHRPEKGDIRLSLEYLPASLRIVVSDRGEGIAAEHLARLTEPFYRADPARAQTTGGLGLGLYLCHTIVQAHGGSLTIDSELQQGTQVRVELPLAS